MRYTPLVDAARSPVDLQTLAAGRVKNLYA